MHVILHKCLCGSMKDEEAGHGGLRRLRHNCCKFKTLRDLVVSDLVVSSSLGQDVNVRTSLTKSEETAPNLSKQKVKWTRMGRQR